MLGPMRRRLAPILLVLACATQSSAQSSPRTPDPLASILDADPMALARAAARIGDAAVLERLGGSHPRSVRVAAMRAAPFMDGPEGALATLAEVAGGRDPRLAPDAAHALLDATATLTSDGLARRECDLASLAETATTLGHIADDATARDDVRAACALAAGRLRALGPVPADPESPAQ